MREEFEKVIKDNFDDFVNWRRHIHANPELSFQEFETTKFIEDILNELKNIEVVYRGETGLVASLKGNNSGKKVALRADIDALPINEQTAVECKSTNEGIMHACGHDVHSAMLLASAKILDQYVDQLNGEVLFIFQPAEEVPPGGAKDIIASGVLDGSDYVFGLHVMPGYETGTIGLRKGPMMASSDRFDLNVIGKGGHAAMPDLAIDPVVISSLIINAFQTIVSRLSNPFHAPILSTTLVNTTGASNIIPDKVNIQGSVRCYNKEVRANTEKFIHDIANGIASTFGAHIEFDYDYGYPMLSNSTKAYDVAYAAAKNFLNEEKIIILEDPAQGSEDFAYYSEKFEANFAVLGIKNVSKETNISMHNPKFKMDEDAMYYGIMLHLQTIKELLM